MSVIAPLLPYAPVRASNPWRWLAITLVVLALTYLAMLNPYWVPSGDGEVYTCIARSLVKGEGLTFNGSRAAIAPPGWPLVLSLAMRISPQFLFLKLVIIGCMLGAMASAFFIVRRYVASDRAAAGIVLITGTLSSIYPLTYWTHTEAFFCLLGFTAILLAFRIAEGRARFAWELPAMLLLLGFGAFTRWPGLLHMVLVVPILLSGVSQPWRRRRVWAFVALIFVACYGTFQVTHSYLSLTAQEKIAAAQNGTVSENESNDVDVGPSVAATATPGTSQPITGADNATPGGGDMMGNSKRGPVAEFFNRIVTAGKWFAWLLWQPTRFGQSVKAIDISALIFGWLAVALLAVTMIRGIARRDYFWVGLALYTGGLCIIWPNPNARYFVPVAPFIVVGIFRGIRELSAILRERTGSRSHPIGQSPVAATTARTLGYVTPGTAVIAPLPELSGRLHPVCMGLSIIFVAATLLSNLPLLAIDIRVFRSSDFYGQYEAGSNKDLLALASYINAHPREGAIAVHEKYENMGRARLSKFGIRALNLLCDKQVIPIERRNKFLRMKPSDDDLRKWLRRADVTYCVTQEAWTPWRVWHFRLSEVFQTRLTGKPIVAETGGWDLWVRNGARYVTVNDVPEQFKPTTRVPGL